MQIQFKKLHLEAIEPSRAHPDDAALDLFAVIDGTRHLGPLGIAKIPTGIAMAIPPGYCGVIKGRSGLGSNGVNVLGGVIDSGYLGEIIVLLQTASDMAVRTGDKIAQLLIVPVPQVTLAEVPEFPTASERGENGFGSTDAVPFKGILHGATAANFLLQPMATRSQEYPGPDNPGVRMSELPSGVPVVHRPGFCLSPYALLETPVDVTGFAPGQEVRCPHTNKVFLVPTFPAEVSRAVAASTGHFIPPGALDASQRRLGAVWDVIRERQKHRKKGYDAAHDAKHDPIELLRAAEAYLQSSYEGHGNYGAESWPWEAGGFHPDPDLTRNAIVAASLLIAFVDRMRQAHDENRVPVNPTEREDTDAR